MRRPSTPLSRRDLIRTFGLSAFLLHPVLRDMAYAAEVPFKDAPRYVMFFKGGAFYPARTNPQTLASLAGTPIAPLEAHAKDIILFKGMNIHGGSPKSEGYKEEHAAGVYGCTTGNTYKYFKNDAYFAYTDNESIDIAIANHYQSREETKRPIASLHIGGGAHSDADQVGVGNRYISFRQRRPGDARYGNAVEPIQDAGQVYDLLMRSAVAVCTAHSNQPKGDTEQAERTLAFRRSFVDTMHAGAKAAKRHFEMTAEQRGAVDQQLQDLYEREKLVRKVAAEAPRATAAKAAHAGCGKRERPIGNGEKKFSLDQLSPVHDQMIDMIKLAFQMDLTRVVAFTLSGASSGQTWPSRGVHKAHHTLEHNGDVDGLVKIDTYYSEKFAGLLQALKSIDDGGGRTALYNSSVFLGMECWSNSSSGHYLTNVPFIFAGQGGGRFETGRIVNAQGRNNNDIHVSCLNAAGVKTNAFGLASLSKGPII